MNTQNHVRTGILAKLLDKDKGDLVYWYKTYEKEYVRVNNAGKRKKVILLNQTI